jgi:hypothetical protein
MHETAAMPRSVIILGRRGVVALRPEAGGRLHAAAAAAATSRCGQSPATPPALSRSGSCKSTQSSMYLDRSTR